MAHNIANAILRKFAILFARLRFVMRPNLEANAAQPFNEPVFLAMPTIEQALFTSGCWRMLAPPENVPKITLAIATY
jgi:hypothetical protein